MAMIPADRQHQILTLIAQDEVVQVQELSERFGVSVLTIRRDLDYLADQGLVERTHGGATLRRTLPVEPLYAQKALEYPHEKKIIGEAAALLIEEGDTIFINSGSTTFEVIKALRDHRITIVTNNIDAAWIANEEAQFRLIFVGGVYRTRSHSVSGGFSEPIINQVHANKAIIGVDGFSLKAGLTTPVIEEAETTRRMIERTVGKVIVVATSNKIGVLSNFSTVESQNIDVLVTDSGGLELLAQEELDEKGIELIIAR
ncbi:MAG: DeoR/GlpR family DNA-binding transcription regulator [Sphaerochaetaceae bacterium]|nr:DeoR/GlpR family DNA-binding transcription regulator [Sphaerochaetaceae bacterium]